MIEESVLKKEREVPTKGLTWALRNKNKVFKFRNGANTEIFYGRIVGLSEDISGVMYMVKSSSEIEGQTILVPIAYLLSDDEIVDTKLTKRVPENKGDKFTYQIFDSIQNGYFYGKLVETPMGRKESR